MKNFTKQEIVGISVILGLIFIASFFNFRVSLRRARDAQRVSDLGQIVDYLSVYHEENGVSPLSLNGKPLACKGKDTFVDAKTGGYVNLLACDWGSDSLLGKLPIDPESSQGVSYLYLSDGSIYQIYAFLESKDEAEYKPAIINRNLNCGNRICNAGRAYGKTPLDKSIEEYENEIRAKQ